MSQFGGYDNGGGGGGVGGGLRIPPRLIFGAIIAVIALVGYFANSQKNPVTGRTQHISLTPQQEVGLGLQSAPEMIHQMGGISTDTKASALVDKVGSRIVASLPPEYPKYPFQYHLLGDRQTVNAFALPGGQVFITEGLLTRLKTEGQLAGVLGHETGHVLARHSAQQMAKGELTQGLMSAAVVATSDGRMNTGQLAQYVGEFLMLKYSRTDELEADKLGLRFMSGAGYDPRAMLGVMEILAQVSPGGGRAPDFMATHPNPENRMGRIKEELEKLYPSGVPDGLKP